MNKRKLNRHSVELGDFVEANADYIKFHGKQTYESYNISTKFDDLHDPYSDILINE